MLSIAWTLLSKICLWDDFRSSHPKKSGWCNFATSEVFARPKFWKVFCLIHDCLCTGDCKKSSIHFLDRKSHISQGECDSISQIATKTKQMLPFPTINCPTSPNEKYHAWNREQLSIYDPCTERSLWRVDPPVEKAWDMDRSRCQFWQRLALAIIPTLIHEQRALLFYIWSSNHFWARHFVIGRIPQNSFDFLFHSRFFHLPSPLSQIP